MFEFSWKAVFLLLLLVLSARATTFSVDSVVDHSSDANPGDGICDDGAGSCTLRAAITEANTLPGEDALAFSIPGPGRHTIVLTGLLPRITDQLVVDGLTQSGSVAGDPAQNIPHNLNIEIDGSAVGYCLWFESDNAVLRGIRTVSCTSSAGGYGVYFSHQNFLVEDSEFIGGKLGIQWDQNGVIRRNLVQGTVVDGLHSFDANDVQIVENAIVDTREDGIFIDSCTNCAIVRNLISGNGVQNVDGIWSGIALRHGVGYVIKSNHIGTDHLGMTAYPNHWGIRLEGVIDGVLIDGNLAAGNDYVALEVGPDVSDVLAQNNNLSYTADGAVLLCNNNCDEQMLDNGPSTTLFNNLMYTPPVLIPGCCQIEGPEGQACIDGEITFGGSTSIEACQALVDEHSETGGVVTHYTPGATCQDIGNGPILGVCPQAGCSNLPLEDCYAPSGRSSLRITRKTPARLKARGSKYEGTSPASFGDPLTVTEYATCLYDDGQLIFQGSVDPGQSWKNRSRGFRFRNKAEATNLVVLESRDSKGRVVVKGKGNIPTPEGTALLQVVNSQGECWDIYQ